VSLDLPTQKGPEDASSGHQRTSKDGSGRWGTASKNKGKKKYATGLDNSGNIEGNSHGLFHIPSDLVVDHWTSDGESRSHRDVVLLHDVWTTSNRLSGYEITSKISMA
jgi:hypothetical protein